MRRESDVPIIMLAAKETHADRINGLESSADDYVVKPFDPDEAEAGYLYNEGLEHNGVGEGE